MKGQSAMEQCNVFQQASQMALTTTNGATLGNLGTGTIQYWPYQDNYIAPWPQVTYYHVTEPPRECVGDVHVFPCPHCDKCKCGAATVKRSKAK